jgi:hypothetical protein
MRERAIHALLYGGIQAIPTHGTLRVSGGSVPGIQG